MLAVMSDTTSPPTARELLAEQERSGLTIAAFSRERGISAQRLYEARRRRDRGGARRPRATFAPVTVVEDRAPRLAFEVELASGRRLRVPPGFDETDLARLVSALETC